MRPGSLWLIVLLIAVHATIAHGTPPELSISGLRSAYTRNDAVGFVIWNASDNQVRISLKIEKLMQDEVEKWGRFPFRLDDGQATKNHIIHVLQPRSSRKFEWNPGLISLPDGLTWEDLAGTYRIVVERYAAEPESGYEVGTFEMASSPFAYQ